MKKYDSTTDGNKHIKGTKRTRNNPIANKNITPEQLMLLYKQSPAIRKRINSGRCLYFDERLIMPSSRHNGNRTKQIKSAVKRVKVAPGKRGVITITRHTIGNYNHHAHEDLLKNAGVRVLLTKETPFTGGGNGGDGGYGEYLRMLMGRRENIGSTALSRLTGIDKKHIDRLRNNEIIRPKADDIIAICVGLHLEPLRESPALLRKCRISLDYDDTRDRFLMAFQKVFWFTNVAYCNRILKDHGFYTMTSLLDDPEE